jgi:hypothetical protein
MSKPTNTNTTKRLTKLLNEAVLLAGEAIALAEAYAGGESETCDELTLQLTKLEARAEKATDKTPPPFDLLPLLYTALDALIEHGDETTEPWIRKQLTLLNK